MLFRSNTSEQIDEKKNIDVEVEGDDSSDIPGENEFEKSIWKVVEEGGNELVSIETIDSEDSNDISIISAILCENDEDVVNSIINKIKDITTDEDSNVSTIITFGDIEKGKDGPMLLMAAIDSDGTTSTSMESSDYNTARNNWIKSQFSAWDGAHTELKKLILKNLNDEKSYKHIETSYIDINSEEKIGRASCRERV